MFSRILLAVQLLVIDLHKRQCLNDGYAVPPAYYAHLAAFRARYYMEPDMSEGGSLSNGRSAAAGNGGGSRNGRVTGGGGSGNANGNESGNGGVRPLPALKENVKRVMFYC